MSTAERVPRKDQSRPYYLTSGWPGGLHMQKGKGKA